MYGSVYDNGLFDCGNMYWPDRVCSRLASRLRAYILKLGTLLFATEEADTIPDQRTSLFEEALRRHDDVISKICFGYARSRSEYEDLRQDSLINIWQGLLSFRHESSLRTWIHRVTLNTCVSTLRKRTREISTDPLDNIYDVIEDTDSDKDMLHELHRRISTLSPTDKAIILLWLDDFSYHEIASMTGVGRNTLATRLRRAKERILSIKEE